MVAYLRYTRTTPTGAPVGSTLELVPLRGGKARVVARTRGPEYGPHFESRPHWLPDATGVAIARRVAERGPWAIELVRLDGSRRVLTPRASPDFTLSPDGRSLVYVRGDTLVVARRGGDEHERIYPLVGLIPKRYSALVEYGGFSWAPNGREVAFSVGGDNIFAPASDLLLRVYALDIATGEIRRLAEIHGAGDAQLAWNPHPDA
jgi:WD40-like Beta Propeller Repeat